jgi:hypothetical protein
VWSGSWAFSGMELRLAVYVYVDFFRGDCVCFFAAIFGKLRIFVSDDFGNRTEL